jgi:hypothetical protein
MIRHGLPNELQMQAKRHLQRMELLFPMLDHLVLHTAILKLLNCEPLQLLVRGAILVKQRLQARLVQHAVSRSTFVMRADSRLNE